MKYIAIRSVDEVRQAVSLNRELGNPAKRG